MSTDVHPSALAAFPAPDPADRFEGLPAPVGAGAPVERFEVIEASDSALLRLMGPVCDSDSKTLIIDGLKGLTPLAPLPEVRHGVVGFVCSRDLLDRDAHFFLETEGAVTELPQPQRPLAGARA